AICDPDGDVLVEMVGAEPSDQDWADPNDTHLRDNSAETIWQSAREIETVAAPF
ncbi:MAG: hypothetical protein HKN28_10405, partial [Alphaproteobacteria bacterium]|nr:hypothetical protein [Alphaproteobacteria bacterium]